MLITAITNEALVKNWNLEPGMSLRLNLTLSGRLGLGLNSPEPGSYLPSIVRKVR